MAQQNKIFTERGSLGQMVITIEFVLISIVQGAAVATLASASGAIVELSNLEYWPYVLAGFIFAMLFWTEAIAHAIGFIDWPFSLGHTFLYFLVGFFEVVAFSNIHDPQIWFACFTLLSVVAIALFWIDLRLIREQREELTSTPKGTVFYKQLESEQLRGLRLMAPLALMFNGCSFVAIWCYPELFLDNSYHAAIIVGQIILMSGSLVIAMRSYRSRIPVLTELYGTKGDFVSKDALE